MAAEPATKGTQIAIIQGGALARPDVVRQYLQQNSNKIREVGKDIEVEKVINSVIRAFDVNPKLAQCSVHSVLQSAIGAQELGLEISTVTGEAFLAPFSVYNKNTREYEQVCQLIPGYKGYIKLGRKSKLIVDVWSDIIYKGETFKISRGDDPRLHHDPDYTKEHSYNEMILAYAVAEFPNGKRHFEVVTKAECDVEVAKNAEMKRSPWNTSRPMMCRKKAVVRLFGQIGTDGSPESEMIEKALSLDYRAEGYDGKYGRDDESTPPNRDAKRGNAAVEEIIDRRNGASQSDGETVDTGFSDGAAQSEKTPEEARREMCANVARKIAECKASKQQCAEALGGAYRPRAEWTFDDCVALLRLVEEIETPAQAPTDRIPTDSEDEETDRRSDEAADLADAAAASHASEPAETADPFSDEDPLIAEYIGAEGKLEMLAGMTGNKDYANFDSLETAFKNLTDAERKKVEKFIATKNKAKGA